MTAEQLQVVFQKKADDAGRQVRCDVAGCGDSFTLWVLDRDDIFLEVWTGTHQSIRAAFQRWLQDSGNDESGIR